MMKKYSIFSRNVALLALSLLALVLSQASCKKAETAGIINADRAAEKAAASIDPTITNRIAPPSSVQSSYSSSLDPTVSDDFNDSSIDWAKWQYRTDGTSDWSTSSSDVYLATVGSDRFLSIKGNYANMTGSGISSRDTVKYGFYIVKWQVSGWADNGSNGWHPSVFGAGCDFSGSGNGNCIPNVINQTHRLEADFMEGFGGTTAYWKSHLLLWYASSIYQNIDMKAQQTTWPNTSTAWNILGMEYTPTYIAVWQNSSGVWTKIKSVPITTAGSSSTNINVAYRTPLYWILSNKKGNTSYITGNSWLHVDYFYHYDYIGAL